MELEVKHKVPYLEVLKKLDLLIQFDVVRAQFVDLVLQQHFLLLLARRHL